jgi:hypothetical protein
MVGGMRAPFCTASDPSAALQPVHSFGGNIAAKKSAQSRRTLESW